MGHAPSTCMTKARNAVAAPEHRNNFKANKASHPTLLTTAPQQDEQAKRLSLPSSAPADEGFGQKIHFQSNAETALCIGKDEPLQNHSASKDGSSRLYSMAELLAQQDLQLMQQSQPQPQPGSTWLTAMAEAHKLSMEQSRMIQSPSAPAEPMQNAQHWILPNPTAPAKQMQNAPHLPQEPTAIHQQFADAYALQQGLQFAAQLSAPSPHCQQEQLHTTHLQPPAQPVSAHVEEQSRQAQQQAQQPAQQQAQQQAAQKSRFAEVPNAVPLASGVERLDPEVVQKLLRSGGCILVDVRGDDRVCGTVEGAVHVQAIDTVPFTAKVPELVQLWRNQPLIIFHCQYSAHRAPQCANWYREQAAQNQRVAIMDGGFRGWESSGLPVLRGAAGQARPDVHKAQRGMQIPSQTQQVAQPHPNFMQMAR